MLLYKEAAFLYFHYYWQNCSVTDPDPFDMDPDPACHFDMGPDPACQFDPNPDPTARSGSLLFQRGNVSKTVFFIHLNLVFLVSRSNRTQPKLSSIFPSS
jgi:hypothetical protein